jgi:long-chain-fatty-acid--CoA ligase ACSBG
MGATLANCIPSGVYATNQASMCLYQAQHSEAEVILVDSVVQLKKYLSIATEIPNLKGIVVYVETSLPKDIDFKGVKVFLWNDFLKLGQNISDSVIETKIRKQKPGHCCALFYTSGTTGNPKGVMMSHDNAVFSIRLQGETMKSLDAKEVKSNRVVSFLPNSHVGGWLGAVMMPLFVEMAVYFAKPDAL